MAVYVPMACCWAICHLVAGDIAFLTPHRQCTIRIYAQVKLGKQELKVTKTATAPQGAGCFAAAFAEPLAADAVETIEAHAVATAVLKPNPAQIAQGETQLMEYSDNLYVVSPYFVSTQTIEVGGNIWNQARVSVRQAGPSPRQ